jgi:hypothetical protein
MGQWEQQIKANALAIQKILDDAKEIKDHPVLVGTLSADDKIVIQIEATSQTIHTTLGALNFGTFNPSLAGVSKGDIIVFDGANWINIGVGVDGYTIEADNTEASGLKWVPKSSKESFVATPGQTIFNLASNPANVDVWVDRVNQIQGTDYNYASGVVTLTYVAEENSLVIIRKY